MTTPFEGDLRGRYFAGCDLTGAVFQNADLYRVSFAGANLEGAKFLDCFAAEAAFEGAQCLDLRAERSSFYRASFRKADLSGAVLLRCVLAGADLRGARVKGVTVTLDCNTFEEILLDRAVSAELAYLFGRARSHLRPRWLDVLGEHNLAWLERVFAR